MSDKLSLGRRLEFFGVSEDDGALLERLAPAVASRADALVAEFYRHLLSYEETRALLRDPTVRDRLVAAQKRYLLSLVSDPVDETYVEQRLKIGRIHEGTGLAPIWYLGAYELHLCNLDRIISEEFASEPEVATRTRAALRRRALLDMELAMEAYISRREEQLAFANSELAASHRGLSREVGEKTEALRETTARAKAAEQLATVGVLAAGLAHEIGTPMGVIRGHAESLTGAVDDQRSKWRVETIIEQIDRITNVMHSLLNLARPRAPVVEDVAVPDVIDTALSFLGEKLKRRKIEVLRDFDPVSPIRGDSEKIQQLLLNLILNAADAMPAGGTLTLRVRAESPERLVTSIADTGVGIDPTDLPRVFDPFFTTKTSGQGNGLGLVVARGIAIDHGGEIEVTSEPGQGTVFRILLPAGPVDERDKSPHSGQ